MAATKELKATARAKAGKGAARAERRAGRVPATVYGENQPSASISVDAVEVGRRIMAGRFLTTVLDIELDGQKTAPAESIPESITADLSELEINDSLHISAIKLPEGVTPVIRDRDFTIATIVPSSGYLEEVAAAAQKAKADAAAAAAPAAAAAAAPAAEAKEGDKK